MTQGQIAIIRQRVSAMSQWLADFAPYTAADQKHLDEDTPERAYWHHGYRAALIDLLNVVDGEQRERTKK